MCYVEAVSGWFIIHTTVVIVCSNSQSLYVPLVFVLYGTKVG
jgi:hypothetical protein